MSAPEGTPEPPRADNTMGLLPKLSMMRHKPDPKLVRKVLGIPRDASDDDPVPARPTQFPGNRG